MSQLLNTAKRHSIVAAYEFDEASGNLLDKIGSNNGTASGTPVYGATDQLGGTEAVEFDGSTDYFTLGSNILNGAISYTIEALVKKADDVTSNQIIVDARDGGSDGVLLYTVSGGVRVLHNAQASIATSGIDSTTGWQHIHATWDGATLRIYIDGVLEDSDAVATAVSTTASGVVGGHSYSAGTQLWNGSIAFLGIYDEALSDTDIQELYQAGRLKPSLTLHHDLSASAIDSNLTSYAGRVASNNFSAAEVAAIFAADSGSGADVWFSSDASGATPIDAKLLYWSDVDSVFAFDVAIASASSSTGATVYLQVGNKPSGYGTDPYDANTLAVTPLISDGTDDSSNGNNVTATGSPTFGGSTGPDGALPATDLDGSSQYFTYGSNLLNGASAYTMEAYVRWDSVASTDVIFDERDSGSDGVNMFASSSGGGTFRSKHNATTKAGAALSVDTWHHVASVWSGTELTAFVDGTGSSPSANATALSTTAAGRIGATSYGAVTQHFDGEIANVYISDTDRSDAWLNANYLLRGSSASTYWTVTDISSSDPLGDKSIELGASHVYVFDEASGKLLDRVGSNDGTASGTPTYRESDQRGLPSAIGFDGSTDYFTLGSNTLNGISAYSVEVVFKKGSDNAGTNRVIVDERDALGDGVFLQLNTNNDLDGRHNAGQCTYSIDDGWHHGIITWDGATLTMYVDGVSVDTAAVATAVATTTAPTVGTRSYSAGLYYDNDISHVAIYPRALTATEVGELYDVGTPKWAEIRSAVRPAVRKAVRDLTYI